MAKVAIVTPVYRLPLLPEEQTSLRHAAHFLSGYDHFLVVPKSLVVPPDVATGKRTVRFSDSYFSGLEGYNQLMLSRPFYDQFCSYDYILIYQLDCLVFSDELQSWCGKGWDYVGAPWFKDCTDDVGSGLYAVGNGGLSLRRVSRFRQVLRSRKRLVQPSLEGDTRFFTQAPFLQKVFLRLKAAAYAAGYKNNIAYFLRNFERHEDLFWSFFAREYVSSFTIPPPEEALGFAFETAPRHCFELNGGQLPFGCHAWYKHDANFWRPFLLEPLGRPSVTRAGANLV